MTRAAPLPLDERRAALIAATEPLIEAYGREVSTRQIAEAAGVAEGTIFRAFPTKEALIDAVIEDAFDPAHTCAALAEVDLGLPLDQRLVRAVGILQERLRRIFALFHSLRLSRPEPRDHESFRARQQADNDRVNSALARLLAPEQNALRLSLSGAASALRTVTFCMTHPMLGDRDLAGPEQIVDLVLHGIVAPDTLPPTRPSPTLRGRSSC